MPSPSTLPAAAPGLADPAGRVPRSARPRSGITGLCAICGGFGRGAVCADCEARWRTIAPRCPRCALAWAGDGVCGACSAMPPAYDAALACVDYAWPWERLVTRFKFHAAFELAALFADDLADAFERQASAERPDLLLPVPLAPGRLRERGANQAWQIARRLARRLRVPGEPALLLRIRETAHQLDLPPAERAANVHAAFALDPLAAARVRGRHVAVIDDVMTTGHTLAEIATLLKRHGARRVSAWAWARTPAPER